MEAHNYIVAEGHEFTYPADAISLQLVRQAGGVSKLTDDQRERISFKTVKAGDDCSDMPQPALGIYINRGWVIPRTNPSFGADTPVHLHGVEKVVTSE